MLQYWHVIQIGKGGFMANPIRLSDELLNLAEKQSKFSFRSVPKQIEFWALIGKEAEHKMTPADIAALVNGEIEIKVLRKKSNPVSFDEVLNEIESDRQNGLLKSKVVKDEIWYEESIEYPGFLARISSTGKKEIGLFIDGQFKLHKPN
jgi:UPF0288 family protein (methanogenesis marker protein 3)